MANTQQKASRRMRLFVLPGIVALAALGWALLQPGEVCTSGGDTSACADLSAVKFFVAMAGVGLAVLIAAVLGFAIGLRRSVIGAGVVVGLALMGVAVASQVRIIT